MNVGIPVRIDAQHAIAHNKIMVIDGATVITGSFNFTKNAEENNAENLLVIRSPDLAAKYTANWQAHAGHSDPYAGRTEGYSQAHRPTGQAEPVAPQPPPTSEGYVASKNSGVFHRGDCKSAAMISEKNLVRYNTREEAERAGKRPCGGANPRNLQQLERRTSMSNQGTALVAAAGEHFVAYRLSALGFPVALTARWLSNCRFDGW